MKKYISPKAEVINQEKQDIITAYAGTETPIYDELDGVFELN